MSTKKQRIAAAKAYLTKKQNEKAEKAKRIDKWFDEHVEIVSENGNDAFAKALADALKRRL